ncbi:Conidiation-specific protein 6 [Crassisporium funariophilum]|nr:Conidiation-specific protein 6 [Crassisporium funariophilum]
MTSNQARGYKATLNNPRVSDEAKQNAKERLDEMDQGPESSVNDPGHEKDEGNVMRGYKATLKNPRVSDEAKKNAEKILKEHDAI